MVFPYASTLLRLLKIFFASTIGFEIPITKFWTGKILGMAAVFTTCIAAKLPVGLYATPLILPNFLVIGVAMVRWLLLSFIYSLWRWVNGAGTNFGTLPAARSAQAD